MPAPGAFTDVTMTDGRLPQIEWSEVDLSNSHFMRMTIQGDLSGASATGARFVDSALNADLSDADLSDLRFEGGTVAGSMSRAQLPRARFSRINLVLDGPEMDATQSRWWDVAGRLNAPDSNLSRAFLEDVQLTRSDLSSADLLGSRWTRVELSDVDFSGADLTAAAFYDTTFERVTFDGATLHETALRGANLRRCTFDGARFIATRLDGADLRGVDLRTVVDLSSAYMEGTELAGAQVCEADRRLVLDKAIASEPEFVACP